MTCSIVSLRSTQTQALLMKLEGLGHDFNISSHGCGIRPPNMCKGPVVERIMASAVADGKKRFIYLGDGKGGFCLSTKLRDEDFVMPRKDYPVWDSSCYLKPIQNRTYI